MISEADLVVKEANIGRLRKEHQAKELELQSAEQIIKKTKEDMRRIVIALDAISELIEDEEEGA